MGGEGVGWGWGGGGGGGTKRGLDVKRLVHIVSGERCVCV